MSKTIAHYLQKQLEINNNDMEKTVKLPSLTELSSFFNCSHLNVYDAIQHLKEKDYEYHLVGLDEPIQLWSTKYHHNS